jgi:hypothetical protein
MMLNRRNYKKETQPVILTKNKSNYRKLEKEMNEPIKEYNSIKKLENNDIENVANKKSKTDMKLIAHQKKS